MISAKTLKLIRQIHLYFGVFISPAILFFAFTGALQTFSLHETTQGSTYKPPQWAVTLGQLHKKQTTVVPVRKPRPADAPGKPSDAPSTDKSKDADKTSRSADTQPQPAPAAKPVGTPSSTAKPKSHLPMKIFFLLVSIGLFTSTITGIIMAYKYNSNKTVVSALLIAGIVIPLLLLPF